jgi:hypothetical protein
LWETGVSAAGLAELAELRPDLVAQMGSGTALTTAIEPEN